ncbi:MAG: MarR family transcriptional regulator [Alcanivoracaceae bacterium]|nr:MarR family transcriptional regulator [Alcanivoracaceae bacterium]
MKHTDKGHIFTEIVLEVFKLSGLLITEGDKITETNGLSSARWKILGALARSTTPLTVSQIARVMGQTRQAVQSLVNIMNKGGLLDFIDNPAHKRAKLVCFTTKSQQIYAKLDAEQIPWANQQSGHLDKTELQATLTILKKISRGLSYSD